MHKMIRLIELRYGHEAEPPINARKTGRDTDIESLMASIQSHGLGQALNVRMIDGKPYVADGNRRLSALRLLAEAGQMAFDIEVKCDVSDGTDNATDADELSLALNFERVPMHEADVYEKFHELHDRGQSEDQIASRFGVDLRRVKRMIALGKLHPVILQAWREDKLGYQASDVVKAFTLAPSIEEQERVFSELSSRGSLYDHSVRVAFGQVEREVRRALKLVGTDAFLDAGGSITEDLFGDDHVISDPALVMKLATDLIKSECDELIADGWKWAANIADLPSSAEWGWETLRTQVSYTDEQKNRMAELEAVLNGYPDEPTDKDEAAYDAADTELDQIKDAASIAAWTSEQKGKSGCVVSVDHQSSLFIKYGVLNPEDARLAAKGATGDQPKVEKVPVISEALSQRLSVQLTQAAQDSIGADPHVALAALLTSLTAGNSYSDPMRVTLRGMENDTRGEGGFETLLKLFLKKTDGQLLTALAKALAPALTFEGINQLRHPQYTCLATAMDGKALTSALADRFDAEDYFKSAPKSIIVPAIAEAVNADEARKAGKLKKAELVKFAVENVIPTGWLPVELRTVHYTGPGAAKTKQPRVKKTPAKKIAAKAKAA